MKKPCKTKITSKALVTGISWHMWMQEKVYIEERECRAGQKFTTALTAKTEQEERGNFTGSHERS